ncbi:DUF3572 domain-containing protein [Meridianimarinicoccus roseus]|uniref:DUF3572 domain-containing protein n=1 Tax=Meridianimarinicoccus roseus TaxID=2072018 RepID=A0A2V2LLU3_9RHOB|nr:DUF3572 domain-containing protein [Meridianimarinicoccus roseus]PWR04037.1 DUF3572 domain-containing protein [Meridianimarinicoccus roseus]
MAPRRDSSLTLSEAETVALQALDYIAGTDDLLHVFVNATGIEAARLPGAAQDPEFLAAVLDFVLMDDAWVLGCAEAAGIVPEAVPRARAALPGGTLPNWT